MPPLGASHSTSEELKDHGVSRAVPAAQKPESVESSTAIALNGSHNRNGSLDSKVLFSRSSSPGSTPTFRTVSGNETKNEIKKELPNSENPAPIGRLESTNQVSATESSYPNLDDNHLVLTSSSQENTSLSSPRSKTPLNRRASLISPAVEAAVKIATRHSHSLHVSNGRALSLTGPKKDRQLQRRSTAMQVASAAALAALEVSFTKAYENQLKRSRVSDMPIIGLQDAVDENGAGSVALEMNGPESDSDPDGHIIVHSRQSTLSTDIPEALMPHPHRQRSLVLRDSIFNPLDIEALFQRFDSGLDGTLTERPTPISLLPRPHARARTQSLDGPTRFSTKSDASSRVSDIISPITTALPMPPLSPTDPDFYYEKNNLVQELEQFLLSYSYADFSSSVVSLSALPKGAAKPAIISGGPADSKSPISVDAMDASNRLSRVDQTPTSFLLPQGLLGLSFKTTSSSFPDDLRLSFVDLILHGLLDPTSESLALYRDAMFVAKKMSPPGLHASGRRGVTLNELLALASYLLVQHFRLPQHQQNFTASTEAKPQSDIDSENGSEDHREADDDMKDTDTEDEERCSELTSGTSISSNPNLIGAIPLPSVSSPLLGSPHSSISGSGTVTTSLIFSDETEILPSQVEPEVSVEVVSLSDSISIILDPPQPRTSLLLGPEGSESTPPESPSTPTGSQIQPDITERQKIAREEAQYEQQ
ncbi:hypothetical protein LENED_001298 [Lentinula edodes]|uniref:Uncharacterized protein n=1 Tax=Lentinula edodes TaxID=5353 RepID=A0A1Q3DY13_LENED|nr:hypothetical protein LENED_001298 [Lentinula edodes]